MKVISLFQTADGKQFTNRDEARQHETECETLAKLKGLLASSIGSELVRRGNIDNVLRHILLESASVRGILTSHAKKTPKQVVAAAAA
jgi:hypothetical protein